MPLNKNAIARYRRLDACLKDRSQRYYIEDLIRECGDAIRTSDDPEATVSRSQVFADIKTLIAEYPGAIVKARGGAGTCLLPVCGSGFLYKQPAAVRG